MSRPNFPQLPPPPLPWTAPPKQLPPPPRDELETELDAMAERVLLEERLRVKYRIGPKGAQAAPSPPTDGRHPIVTIALLVWAALLLSYVVFFVHRFT